MVFVTLVVVVFCSAAYGMVFLFRVGVGFFFGRFRVFVVLRVVFLSGGIACRAIGGC